MSREKFFLAFFFCLLILSHSLFTFLSGVQMGLDTQGFSRWADILLESNFDFFEFNRKATFYIPLAFYSGFITLIAISKKLFGESWIYGVIFFNLVSEVSISVLICFLLQTYSSSGLSILFSGSLFLFCFEIFQWTRYVLSDATNLVVSFFPLFLLWNYSGNWANRTCKGLGFLGIGIAFLGAVFYRPTNIALFPCVLSGMLLYSNPQERGVPQHLKIHLGLLIVTVCFLSILQTSWMKNPEGIPSYIPGQKFLQTVSQDYQKGIVGWDRPSSFLPPPETTFGFLKITVAKFFFFFRFWAKEYSWGHNLWGILYFPPLYVLSLLAWSSIFSQKPKIPPQKRIFIFLLGEAVICYAVFHSFTQVDYDWRYRLPIMPHLLILATLGFERIFLSPNRV